MLLDTLKNRAKLNKSQIITHILLLISFIFVGISIVYDSIPSSVLLIVSIILYLVTVRQINESIKLKNSENHLTKIMNSTEKLVTIGMISTGLAHQVNNALTVIKGRLFILRERVEEAGLLEKDEVIKESLSHSNEYINKISKIIDDLRSYSRIEDLSGTPTDIDTIVDFSTNLFSSIYKKNRIQVDTAFTCKNVYPNRPLLLRQVLTNLISNSIDAITVSTNVNKGLITVQTYMDKDNAVIKVIDNGIGIKDTDIKHIYEPFFTTKSNGHSTGFGLTIVKSMLLRLNGKITISTEFNKGTIVTVTIPVSRMLSVS